MKCNTMPSALVNHGNARRAPQAHPSVRRRQARPAAPASSPANGTSKVWLPTCSAYETAPSLADSRKTRPRAKAPADAQLITPPSPTSAALAPVTPPASVGNNEEAARHMRSLLVDRDSSSSSSGSTASRPACSGMPTPAASAIRAAIDDSEDRQQRGRALMRLLGVRPSSDTGSAAPAAPVFCVDASSPRSSIGSASTAASGGAATAGSAARELLPFDAFAYAAAVSAFYSRFPLESLPRVEVVAPREPVSLEDYHRRPIEGVAFTRVEPLPWFLPTGRLVRWYQRVLYVPTPCGKGHFALAPAAPAPGCVPPPLLPTQAPPAWMPPPPPGCMPWGPQLPSNPASVVAWQPPPPPPRRC